MNYWRIIDIATNPVWNIFCMLTVSHTVEIIPMNGSFICSYLFIFSANLAL
jgi:hypothetical protein